MNTTNNLLCESINLPDDIFRYMIINNLVNDPTFLSLSFVSKTIYHICSKIGVELNLDKKIAYDNIAFNNYRNLLIWVNTMFGTDGQNIKLMI